MRRPLPGRTAAAAAGSTVGQPRVQCRSAELLQLRLQPGPHGGVGAREVQLVEDRPDVQPGPSDEQRDDARGAQPVDLRPRPLPVLGHGRRFAHVPQVEQVVRHPAPFGGVGLGRADVHAAVELHRVGVDHLAAEPARQLHGERGLAGGGRPDHGHDRRRLGHLGRPVGHEVADAEGRDVGVQPPGHRAAGQRVRPRPATPAPRRPAAAPPPPGRDARARRRRRRPAPWRRRRRRARPARRGSRAP